jgi:hypothetical protein
MFIDEDTETQDTRKADHAQLGRNGSLPAIPSSAADEDGTRSRTKVQPG